jgi:hypothetical protein
MIDSYNFISIISFIINNNYANSILREPLIKLVRMQNN